MSVTLGWGSQGKCLGPHQHCVQTLTAAVVASLAECPKAPHRVGPCCPDTTDVNARGTDLFQEEFAMGRPKSVLPKTGTWNLRGCTQSQSLCSDFPKVTLPSQLHRNKTSQIHRSKISVDLRNNPNCTAHWNHGVLGARKKNGGKIKEPHI